MATKVIKAKTNVPYTCLVGKAPTKPIFSAEIQARLDEAVAPITGSVRWAKWGMPVHSTALLFHGPPGCGKTTAAKYLAKRVSNGIIEITMADVGSGDPGSTEKATREIFAEARNKDNCTIFIDECDGVLMSRERLGPDAMWMLTVINCFMTQIEIYPGLVILASNFQKILDPALQSKLSDIIEIPFPSPEVRYELWEQKIPEPYPVQLNHDQLNDIATIALTGREIENCIQKETRKAIRLGRNPKWESLRETAKEMEQTIRGSQKGSQKKV